MMNLKYIKTSFFIFFILSIQVSYATTIFDTILQQYSNVATTWSSKLLPVARYIFWTISLIEFLYQISIKKVLPNDIQKLWVFGITRVIVCTLLSLFVLDINTYTGIISWFCELGSAIGGTDLAGSGSQLINFSPSQLFLDLYKHYAPTLFALTAAAGLTGFVNGSLGIFLFMFAFAINACIIIMVIVVMLTILEAYFVLFAGIILAGFAGSSWTMNYWQKYLGYVGGVAIRLFCTALLLGLLTTSNWSWITPPPTAIELSKGAITSPGSIMQNLIAMFGVFLFNMVLMVTLPSKAASMLNGAVNAGLGEAIGAASLAMSGGRMMGSVAGAAMGGSAALTKGALNAASSAKSAGFKSLRDGARSQIGSEKTGSEVDWKAALKSQASADAKAAGVNSVKQGATDAKNIWKKGSANIKQHGGAFARNSNTASGPAAGGSSLNIDPHKHQ